MTKLIACFLIAAALFVNADSFRGKILFDPVTEINSLTLSKDAVIRQSFHYIDGEPVQCLRISLLPGTSRTSLFVKIKTNASADKKINFICAVASTEKENNKIAFCKLIANGSELFKTIINNNQPVYLRGIPVIDNNGDVNLAFEISYDSSKDVFPVDLILPALISLHKFDNETQKSDLQFGTTDSGYTWRFPGIEEESSNFNKTDSVFLVPEIQFSEIIPKSIEPQAGTPVKIIAIIKNTGWRDYICSSGNVMKISIDNKTGTLDEKNQTQLIPAVPAGGSAEIEWTIFTYQNISDLKGELGSTFLKTKTGFTIPLFNDNKFASKSKSDSGWETIVNKKDNMIAYDWMQDGVRIRFVKSLAGVERMQFSIKKNNKYRIVAAVNELAKLDVIIPNDKVITLSFSPKTIRYFDGLENKVLIRGWAFNKKIGGVTIEQYYSRPKGASKINIETKITAKNDIRIAKIYNSVFHLEADENSAVIIPGSKFERLISSFKPKEFKWMFYNMFSESIPVSKQLIPFFYADSLHGSICFEKPSGIFKKDNMMWTFDKKNGGTKSRYIVSDIIKPHSGVLLKHLKSKESISVNLSVEILPENVDASKLLPDVLQLGVIPVPLVDAEKERLIKKFVASVSCTNSFTSDEMKEQTDLLHASKNKKWSLGISDKINELYSGMTNKINTDDCDTVFSQNLCTEYDWILDKNISGDMIIGKFGIEKINDDVLELLNNGKMTGNNDAISIGKNLLLKLRNKLIYASDNHPNLLNYTKLAKANALACKISGDQSFALEANRLLRLGGIFMRRSTEKATRGIGMAEENIGSPTPQNNFTGLSSPHATIAFADALYDAAEVDKLEASRKRRLADLLIKTVDKFYVQENINGLIPEFWSPEFNVPAGEYKRPYSLWQIFLRQNKLLN
ncbi:hypothetical protein KAH27_00915 [bacterium]|nr:hypothetical protein [bacterium]